MSVTAQNKEVSRRIFDDLWNQGDLAVADEIFARPEGVKRYIQNFLAAFPDLHHTVHEIISEGDQVVASWTAQGTHMGEFHGIPATGKPVTYTGITIVQMEEGKISQHRTQWDTLALLEQLGAVPIIRKADGSRL